MSKKGFLNTTVLLTVSALISKILALIKDMFVASKFGASSESDTFLLVNTTIILIASLITQANNAVFLPELVKAEINGGMTEKNKLARNMKVALSLVALFIVISCYIGTPLLLKGIAPGFNSEERTLATSMFRMSLPVVLMTVLSSVNISYLQTFKRYTETALNDIILNTTCILSLVFISNTFGIYALTLAVVIGHLLQLLLQVFGLKTVRYKHIGKVDLKDERLLKIVKLAVPMLISIGISDLNKMIDKAMASGLSTGTISGLNYASKISTLVLGILIVPLTTSIFPILSEHIERKKKKEFTKTIETGISYVFLLTLPISAALVAIGKLVVQILFERGSFNSYATELTSECVIFYAIALVGMSIRLLMIKAFYSMQNTKTPVINGAICIVINIILNIILCRYIAHIGLTMATAISSTLLAVILIYSFNKKMCKLNIKMIVSKFFKCLFSAAIMGIVVYFIYNYILLSFCSSLINRLLVLATLTIIGISIYLVLLLIFKMDDVSGLIKVFTNRFRKKG